MPKGVEHIPAVVPAAGRSKRMGRPKLLLEVGGEPLIRRVVSALRRGGANPVIVVAPPADKPEGPPVAEAARNAGATVITPACRPPEMREAVEQALPMLARQGPPRAFLLTPADVPGITPQVVGLVLEQSARAPGAIVIPCVQRRRSHPIVLPWDLAGQIPGLPLEQGINALVAANPERVIELGVDRPELLADIDTPEDFQTWNERFQPAFGPATRVALRLFAVAKERAGRAEIEVELPLPATVGDLRLALAMQCPELASLAPRVMIAVDSEYAADETMITPGARLALIPPVSGGGSSETA